jgi:hypothetical protein
VRRRKKNKDRKAGRRARRRVGRQAGRQEEKKGKIAHLFNRDSVERRRLH